LSTTSTADGSIESSPVLPPLPAPKLPERALDYLRTPPSNTTGGPSRYITASWGSPYPYPPTESPQARRRSFGSEASDDSPIHQLEIHTPFLRPVPDLSRPEQDQTQSSFVSAVVLANRARRPTRGITEDWIRQHTTGNLISESQHWFSDGTGSSGHSSLSGSFSGDDAASWLDQDLQTPRPGPDHSRQSRGKARQHPRNRSSIETLKQEDIDRGGGTSQKKMASPEFERVSLDNESDLSLAISMNEMAPQVATPKKSTETLNSEPRLPSTPVRGTPSRITIKEPTMTPRLRKKVPWKGKNIMVLLPRDDERGRLGNAPLPLTRDETTRMFRSWEELGYDISGFDLDGDGSYQPDTVYCQSRGEWPDVDEIANERLQRRYQITLPDLNGEYPVAVFVSPDFHPILF
jgi:hypothetical protein